MISVIKFVVGAFALVWVAAMILDTIDQKNAASQCIQEMKNW